MREYATAEISYWQRRLVAVPGGRSPRKVRARLEAMGEKRIYEQLDPLKYPPTDMEFAYCSAPVQYCVSRYELFYLTHAIEELQDETKAAFELLARRDRVKAHTCFWEVIGARPNDYVDPTVCDPRHAWELFVRWKTHQEIGRRISDRVMDSGRDVETQPNVATSLKVETRLGKVFRMMLTIPLLPTEGKAFN